MWCQSCKEEYEEEDAGTCKECYEEASETEEELKREIDDLRSRLLFLRLPSPSLDASSLGHSDLLLHAIPASSTSSCSDASAEAAAARPDTPAVPAHRVILASRSPVFRAMLENEMEESRSGIIKIYDVCYDVLRAFIHYMYTAEALLDEQMASDLLVLAEKYEVKNLKAFCEKFLTSKVSNDNAIAHYAFAHRHSAKQLLETSLSAIMDNMSTLADREEYKELVEKDPRLVVEIYEAYLNRQVNTAAGKETDSSNRKG
ncbi:BTB/POZ domain-containing protein At4g08455 [Oryza brachyantha]|uniref:C2-BTB1+-+Bric-a-Brac+Tramtrack+Broad+Complex+BTB+domain+with+C2+subfamily n=1 Tax=Oryza brachyantha TaxID=4533 RepID=G8JB93_ORYBR|nr:BTB/POZ domain-containing protein At4g08455 [Oryza brachyantha]AER41571.1 C2-BTB1+-+Bric-a-Brac+Tramtrack+Broad+Complex+BTB+domain+with+C2+subfamily [Oryza brachyantha]